MDYALLLEQHAGQGWPRQRQLHESLRAAIRSGTLAAGTRLPPSRALAQELGIARNTVLYAYDQLATEGFVQPDRRGTVVKALIAPIMIAPAAAPTRLALSRRAQAVGALAPIAIPDVAFAAGVPALDEFPVQVWRRLLERAWRGGARQLNYADTAGEPALRQAIADHLRAGRGAICDASQVFITDGTQSTLDLCARLFADSGDRVWIENPGYNGALAAFRAAQLTPVPIEVDEDGIRPTPAQWRRSRPRLIYVTPSQQYPSGGVLPLERRLALIEGARQGGALIIEDDYDSEFRHDGPPLPAMQGLAPDAPVLYVGTFSKTMFPGLRIGFVVVPAALAEAVRTYLARASARGRSADQLALAAFLREGHFGLHLRRMRRLYRQRRDALVDALERHMGAIGSVHGASAGMHLALRLFDDAIDDVAVSERALGQGLVVAPLSTHAGGLKRHGWNGFLLGYAQVPVERIDGAVRKLAAVARWAR